MASVHCQDVMLAEIQQIADLSPGTDTICFPGDQQLPDYTLLIHPALVARGLRLVVKSYSRPDGLPTKYQLPESNGRKRPP